MQGVLWLTGLFGSALCLIAHLRGTVRTWLPSALALVSMALMAPGTAHWQAVLACLGSLSALIGVFLLPCPHGSGRRADLVMMSVLTAAMLPSHGHHGHRADLSWGDAGLAVFFVSCWLVLRAGAALVGRAWGTPRPAAGRRPLPNRLLDEVGGALMMTGMACM
ncbi:hypothetical protein KVH15_22155 [Streptomyces olivaceus]|uniref:hypothetical protein n=1 Tax=Streptomyces olivaceus TaxID=47716 RepID=UPI001CCEA51B|nr:hypothetical protein [Streptomyces olivaceus]MBZ6083712.1 hypothetical protein [Streptomyces olivaceus]